MSARSHPFVSVPGQTQKSRRHSPLRFSAISVLIVLFSVISNGNARPPQVEVQLLPAPSVHHDSTPNRTDERAQRLRSTELKVREFDETEGLRTEKRALESSGLTTWIRNWSPVDRDLLVLRAYEFNARELQARYPKLPARGLQQLSEQLYGKEAP